MKKILQINYLAKNDGHRECPKKVVCHLKDLSEHGVWKWQLSDHQQGLLRIEEAAEVTAAAANMEHTICLQCGIICGFISLSVYFSALCVMFQSQVGQWSTKLYYYLSLTAKQQLLFLFF